MIGRVDRSNRRRPVVVVTMDIDEAADIGLAIQDAWPSPDLAWHDGAMLIELSEQAQQGEPDDI